MISYEDAQSIIVQAGQRHDCQTESILMQNAIGRVIAEDIMAPINIQPFDNAAMDGFAVRLNDLKNDGSILIRAGTIAAGDEIPEEGIQAGHCIEIMTGGPVPPGTEAVVPSELAEVRDRNVYFRTQPDIGANIRRVGEDFKKGMEVLRIGQAINLQHIMPLATLGIDKIEVFKKLNAGFLATGNELVDDLAQNLKSGQIYNSNLYYGSNALKTMGVHCVDALRVPDDPEQFEIILKNLLLQEVDFIVSSGAVSVGQFDFIRKSLEQYGAEILFHRVNIKPGKPILFARFPNGALYFGLPGNPVATAVGLRFFVQPCLRAIMKMEKEKSAHASTITSFKKRGGSKMFLKARMISRQDGSLGVDLLNKQASFMVNPFLKMNCWVALPENVEEVLAGDIVDVYPLYPHTGFP